MMRKIPVFLTLLTLSIAYAQEGSEEAIILNQEMQFLEESARATAAPTPLGEVAPVRATARRSAERDSLEDQYFKDTGDDVSTRAAAPKRRRL